MASATAPRGAAAGPWARFQELILPVAVIASILVILVPLPSGLMSLLLAANITIAVIMLLTTIYVRTPLEFNIFPSLLLATTLFRLVLNVATTRLILTRASQDGLNAAGGVVRTFGETVTSGSLVVGLIIFAIIVVIQFVVITKGATRISEVAARFTLDGMPGRQMAIDADLSAGVIDHHEARRRREEITASADFFGAMDGASKFVRGDAIAGIIITLINIVGGLFIGIVQYGWAPAKAASLFTTLTIGDGLASQVPAFLIAIAAGLLVTRSSRTSNLPQQFLSQLFSRPEALAVAGGFLGVLIFTNLPKIPLLVIGGGCVGLAIVLRRKAAEQATAEAEEEAKAKKETEAKSKQKRVEDYLAIDPMELELGVGLLRLVDRQRGGDLLDRIQHVRQELAAEIGIILPKVRIRDNLRLSQDQYRIKIADMPVAEGVLRPGHTAVEPGSVVANHLAETVRRHADEILTRDATKHLIDELKQTSPAVVDELIPGVMNLADVQQVLQILLREAVSIRQFGAILETLGDYAPRTKNPILLAEHVRARLARAICTRYRDAENRLYVATLDPAVEGQIRDGFELGKDGLLIRMSPQAVEAVCGTIAADVEALTAAGRPPVLLVSPPIRAAVKQMTGSHLPNLIVLSYNEITRDTAVESVAMVVSGELVSSGEVSQH